MKQFTISVILALTLFSCNPSDSIPLTDFIKGDWWYLKPMETSSLDEDRNIDSTYIDSIYAEIFFDGRNLDSYNSSSGAGVAKKYKISSDTIYFYHDSIAAENIYLGAILSIINDSVLLIKNNSARFQLTRIDNSEYTYSKETKFLDSLSIFKSDDELYDSLIKNKSENYYNEFYTRELKHKKP